MDVSSAATFSLDLYFLLFFCTSLALLWLLYLSWSSCLKKGCARAVNYNLSWSPCLKKAWVCAVNYNLSWSSCLKKAWACAVNYNLSWSSCLKKSCARAVNYNLSWSSCLKKGCARAVNYNLSWSSCLKKACACAVNSTQGVQTNFFMSTSLPSLKLSTTVLVASSTVGKPKNWILLALNQMRLLKLSLWFWVAPSMHLSKSSQLGCHM